MSSTAYVRTILKYRVAYNLVVGEKTGQAK
jgi:hypothetical protein